MTVKCRLLQSTYVGDENFDYLMKSIDEHHKQPFKFMDYLYIAFANLNNVDPDHPKIFYESTLESRVYKIIEVAKRQNAKVQILAQFNWLNYLDPLAQDQDKIIERIDEFARSVPAFLEQYEFKGVDFDWEYDRELQERMKLRARLNTEELTLLLCLVKLSFGNKPYLLSISPDTKEGICPTIVNSYVDIVNVQSYNRLGYIDDFIEFGIKKEKINVGICSEHNEKHPREDQGYYPPNGDISEYTEKVKALSLPGLYAWRIDNDDLDMNIKLPRYTITEQMWDFSREGKPPV
jgi:Glycosyl hydrolases family 18